MKRTISLLVLGLALSACSSEPTSPFSASHYQQTPASDLGFPGNTDLNPAFVAGCNGLSCEFYAQTFSPPGTGTLFSWTFGDGTSFAIVDDEEAEHVYAAAGDYTVTLVTSRGTQSVTSSQVVHVGASTCHRHCG